MNEVQMALIYDKYSSAVYRAAFAYCRNTADAEDIMQETFIKRFRTDIDFPDDKAEKAIPLAAKSYMPETSPGSIPEKSVTVTSML